MARVRATTTCRLLRSEAALYAVSGPLDGTGPSIRDPLGERDRLSVGDGVHVAAADHIAVAVKTA